MKLKIEKKDGIDVVIYADCPPEWSRPASPDEVALWDRIVELEQAIVKAHGWINVPMQASDAAGLRTELAALVPACLAD